VALVRSITIGVYWSSDASRWIDPVPGLPSCHRAVSGRWQCLGDSSGSRADRRWPAVDQMRAMQRGHASGRQVKRSSRQVIDTCGRLLRPQVGSSH
jgi:hypothetical protein